MSHFECLSRFLPGSFLWHQKNDSPWVICSGTRNKPESFVQAKCLPESFFRMIMMTKLQMERGSGTLTLVSVDSTRTLYEGNSFPKLPLSIVGWIILSAWVVLPESFAQPESFYLSHLLTLSRFTWVICSPWVILPELWSALTNPNGHEHFRSNRILYLNRMNNNCLDLWHNALNRCCFAHRCDIYSMVSDRAIKPGPP